MSAIWVLNNIENKHALYRGKDCMKKFCESLREYAETIIGSGKKKMLPLTKEELELYQDAKNCYIFRKRIAITQVNIEVQRIVL